MDFTPLNVSGRIAIRTVKVSRMIDHAPAALEVAEQVVPELEDRLARVDQRLEDVGDEHGL